MHAARPSVHDLMDLLTPALGTYHHVVALANVFFSTTVVDESRDQFAFTLEGLSGCSRFHP